MSNNAKASNIKLNNQFAIKVSGENSTLFYSTSIKEKRQTERDAILLTNTMVIRIIDKPNNFRESYYVNKNSDKQILIASDVKQGEEVKSYRNEKFIHNPSVPVFSKEITNTGHPFYSVIRHKMKYYLTPDEFDAIEKNIKKGN